MLCIQNNKVTYTKQRAHETLAHSNIDTLINYVCTKLVEKGFTERGYTT